jgi:mannose-6-phosphate isomerase-like protein (cupin superfamily)
LTRRASLEEGIARLPGPAGERYATVIEHGALTVEIYAPRGADPQTPHTRDEVYVVMSGKGWFVNGPDRHRFGPGDVLFVPAGVVHRFEKFSEDLVVWAVFC